MTHRVRYRPRGTGPKSAVTAQIEPTTRALLEESGHPSSTAGEWLDERAAKELKKRAKLTKEKS